jgi:CheY-like chemotaxis protein
LASVLEGAGAVVHAAESAAAAKRRLREQRPDVLICDIEMPSADGYQLVRGARQSRDSDIPRRRRDAHARPMDRGRAAAAGFAVGTSKSLDRADLVSAVRSIVRNRRPSAQGL